MKYRVTFPDRFGNNRQADFEADGVTQSNGTLSLWRGPETSARRKCVAVFAPLVWSACHLVEESPVDWETFAGEVYELARKFGTGHSRD